MEQEVSIVVAVVSVATPLAVWMIALVKGSRRKRGWLFGTLAWQLACFVAAIVLVGRTTKDELPLVVLGAATISAIVPLLVVLAVPRRAPPRDDEGQAAPEKPPKPRPGTQRPSAAV